MTLPQQPTRRRIGLGRIHFLAEDPIGGFLERTRAEIRSGLRRTLGIVMVEEDGAAPGGRTGIDVAPAVANQKAVGQVDVVTGGSFQQQSGFRFPAIAGVAVVVPADEEIIERQGGGDGSIHPFDRSAGLVAPSDVGLIGNDDQ